MTIYGSKDRHFISCLGKSEIGKVADFNFSY
jgi:hypothetical protein